MLEVRSIPIGDQLGQLWMTVPSQKFELVAMIGECGVLSMHDGDIM